MATELFQKSLVKKRVSNTVKMVMDLLKKRILFFGLIGKQKSAHGIKSLER